MRWLLSLQWAFKWSFSVKLAERQRTTPTYLREYDHFLLKTESLFRRYGSQGTAVTSPVSDQKGPNFSEEYGGPSSWAIRLTVVLWWFGLERRIVGSRGPVACHGDWCPISC